MVHAEEIVHSLRKLGSTLLPFAKPAPHPSPPVCMLEGVCVDGMRSHPWTQRMPRVHLNDTGAHTPLTLRRSRPLHSVPLAWALGCPPHNPPRECTSVPESILLQPAPNASSETGPGTAPGSASTLLLVAQRSTLSSWLRAELVHVYADQKSST